jgi:hypothetical protein
MDFERGPRWTLFTPLFSPVVQGAPGVRTSASAPSLFLLFTAAIHRRWNGRSRATRAQRRCLGDLRLHEPALHTQDTTKVASVFPLSARGLLGSPWWRSSIAAVVGRGERAASWPLFYMARCALLRWPSLAPRPTRWSRSYETDSPQWHHGHGVSGEANAPCGHLSSSSPIFKGTPCLAAWRGLQRVSPSLYRAVAGGTASPWPSSGDGEHARRSHVQPAFPSARWLDIAPFLKSVCARMCV